MRIALPFLILTFALLAVYLAIVPRRHFTGTASAADMPITATTMPGNVQQATFAAGCFWGVEEQFRHVKGVLATAVGYTGGHTVNPTYKEVCTDLTGHAEAVLVTYDPTQVSYAELLDAFWTAHDPTTKDRQGPDFGSQYRSAIFFHTPEQEQIARASLKEVDAAKFFKNKIVTEITAAAPFYKAEEYHQQYMLKTGGICHIGPATVTTKLAKEAAAARVAQGAAPATRPN
jgi:peptide-methionine (S)-S-oxide reductase